MATAAQVEANRANAQKSTGPRTPEGKEQASQNALKHGLFSREAVIRGEDEDEFEMHQERLLGQLNPVGPLEEILAARIVDLAWRLKRAVQDQDEAFAALYERQTAGAEKPQEPAERAATLGRMILEDFSQNAVLERLLRYERRIESSLYRTLNQLRRVHDQLQKADLEDASTLERWREEDWSARKARSFACCPPADVSPGPAGGTTNTPGAEVPHPGDLPSLQYPSPAPDGPAEDETGKTNPIPGGAGWDGATGAGDEGRMRKTNPISADAAVESPPYSSIPSFQHSSPQAWDAEQLCKTNPIRVPQTGEAVVSGAMGPEGARGDNLMSPVPGGLVPSLSRPCEDA